MFLKLHEEGSQIERLASIQVNAARLALVWQLLQTGTLVYKCQKFTEQPEILNLTSKYGNVRNKRTVEIRKNHITED